MEKPENPAADRPHVANGQTNAAAKVVRYTNDCTAEPRERSSLPKKRPIAISKVD